MHARGSFYRGQAMDGLDGGGSFRPVRHCRSIFPGGLLTSMMEMTEVAPSLGERRACGRTYKVDPPESTFLSRSTEPARIGKPSSI